MSASVGAAAPRRRAGRRAATSARSIAGSNATIVAGGRALGVAHHDLVGALQHVRGGEHDAWLDLDPAAVGRLGWAPGVREADADVRGVGGGRRPGAGGRGDSEHERDRTPPRLPTRPPGARRGNLVFADRWASRPITPSPPCCGGPRRVTFPPVDGVAEVLPPDADGTHAVVCFTGHAYLLTDRVGGVARPVRDRTATARRSTRSCSSRSPASTARSARPTWCWCVTGSAVAAGWWSAPTCATTHGSQRAREHRRDVRVLGDERGLVTIGAGPRRPHRAVGRAHRRRARARCRPRARRRGPPRDRGGRAGVRPGRRRQRRVPASLPRGRLRPDRQRGAPHLTSDGSCVTA